MGASFRGSDGGRADAKTKIARGARFGGLPALVGDSIATLPFMNYIESALELVREGQTLGLGTGRAAEAFIEALGRRARGGLRIRGVPSSRRSEILARAVGIPLAGLDEVERLDWTFDGADEIDPELNLIKGMGGALVREKILASASVEGLVVLAGSEKETPKLGARKGVLPVEVLPFGWTHCRRALARLGLESELRPDPEDPGLEWAPFQSDNRNYILDCRVGAIEDPEGLARAIRAIPGVVDHGLFLGMARVAYIQDGETTRTVRAPGR